MVEPFSPFTKVVVRPCVDCKGQVAILVGSRVLRGEVVSVRCPECWAKFKKKYPSREDEKYAFPDEDNVKPGDGE